MGTCNHSQRGKATGHRAYKKLCQSKDNSLWAKRQVWEAGWGEEGGTADARVAAIQDGMETSMLSAPCWHPRLECWCPAQKQLA